MISLSPGGIMGVTSSKADPGLVGAAWRRTADVGQATGCMVEPRVSGMRPRP